MNKQKTGALIKTARIEKGYTQIELGDLLGVSNKAVSRWENGDSFPDIGVLESLSKILDLRIQDIVIGEVEENSHDTAVAEIVRMARIQEGEKIRNNISRGVGLALIVYLLFRGYYFLSGNVIGHWMAFPYYYSLVLILLFVSVKCVFDKESLNPLRSKLTKWFAGFSLISGTYSSVLMCLTIVSVSQGNTPFNMKLSSVGLFLNNQLILIFAFNIIIFIVECFRVNYNDAAVCLDVYFSVAVIHLVLVYSDMLRSLISPEEFLKRIVYNSIVILVETILTIVITYIIMKNNKGNVADDLYNAKNNL